MQSNSELLNDFLVSSGISTDTRKIQAGNLFFALRGPNFNANVLAKEALEKGAMAAVIDDPDYQIPGKTRLVPNALLALQDLARDYRQSLNIPIIGLTGSNGKTTTKELLYAVLSQKYHCFATKGNLNNHIGVPLSLLSIKAEHALAIIEMGANKLGDIQELVEIAQPSHGLITNIGKAHLEGFGGIEGVIKGKGELFDYLQSHQGCVFLPANAEPIQRMAAQRQFGKVIQANEALPCHLVSASPFVVYEDAHGQVVHTQLPGVYNFENMQMAIAVGKEFGLSDAQCHAGIAAYQAQNHRSQFIQLGSNRVLMDAYNANPSSMAAAIRHFAETAQSPKIVILGDMFELGEESEIEHAAMGALLAECSIDQVLLLGPHMAHALPHLPKAYYFPDKFGLHTWLQDHPIRQSQILVKGSRGLQMESVLPFLEIT